MDFIAKISLTKVLLLYLIVHFYNENSFSQCYNESPVENNIDLNVHGNLDFTIIGNSQNPLENNSVLNSDCKDFIPNLITHATLNVPNGDSIKRAYMYWSGSGNPINQVLLNNKLIESERCWHVKNEQVNQFSAFADVTDIIQSRGEGIYEFSGLDNTNYYTAHNCDERKQLLYGGWAIVVIFENKTNYQNSTISVYEGLDFLQFTTTSVSLYANVLNSFNDSHIGVVAWEGDEEPFTGTGNIDKITLNGEVLPSNGYTSPDNIFNGTNSFVNPVETIYNVDIDDFDSSNIVESSVNNGPTQFLFELSTGFDRILLSTLVFKVPIEAPDAVIRLDNIGSVCESKFNLNFEIENKSYAQKPIPKGTLIHFYLNNVGGELLAESKVLKDVFPSEIIEDTIIISLPENYSDSFEIIAYIDPILSTKNGYGSILELEESNNSSITKGSNQTEIFFPKAFTPNNDSMNDSFKGVSNSSCPALLTHYNLKVYNSFGNLVANIKDNEIGWLGFQGTELAPSGTYTWFAEYSISIDNSYTQSGIVTLIR